MLMINRLCGPLCPCYATTILHIYGRRVFFIPELPFVYCLGSIIVSNLPQQAHASFHGISFDPVKTRPRFMN